jgi:hypothetical protein
MADSYTIVAADKAVQVLSQTSVADVETVSFYTKPSGVFCKVQVPLAAWTAGKVKDYVKPVATMIETLFSDGVVTAAAYVQDVDSSGLLASFMDFTVSFQENTALALPYTTVVRVPVSALSSETAFQANASGGSAAEQILDAYNQLVATSQA